MVSIVPRNLKLTLSYMGASYRGWQVQPAVATVQGELAAAIERITGERCLPQGSGRTDAGVHALAQVASWQTESSIPPENLLKALNSHLPPTIRVLAVEPVAADFHARHSARSKTYLYRIHRGTVCPPFLADQVWHHPYPLDEETIRAAAAEVIGEHDFTSFAAVDAEKREAGEPSPVRQITRSEWRREGEESIYEVSGSGFLHHMVRNLVGTLVLAGKGSLQVTDIAKIIAARSRAANPGATAPACGLYLVKVEY